MTRILTLTALCALAASPTLAGGWETGKLDTSFLYEDGNYVELSYGSLDYSVNGTTQAVVTHPMAKDQTRRSVSGKFQVGNLDVGITSFDSGALQLDGQNPAAGVTFVPSADVKIATQALVGRYSFNNGLSVSAGLRESKVQGSTLTTTSSNYTINSASGSGLVYGVSYQIPEYAMKVELLRSEAISIGLQGTATARGVYQVMAGSTPLAFDPSSSLGIPAADTLKFQTGIAADTLVMASIHRVKWKPSQIDVNIDGNVAQQTVLNNQSTFENTTAYSLGLGRKLSESTSASLTYSWEKGTGSTSTSPFTLRNGSKTLSVGLKHTIDALTISGGLSYTKAGDVFVSSVPGATGQTANYTGNSVTAFGLKVGYNF